MIKPLVKIRGIYTTALTKLLLDNGYGIVQSSLEIQKRFHIPSREVIEDIFIQDREDHQGILVYAREEFFESLFALLKTHLFDIVPRCENMADTQDTPEENLLKSQSVYNIEFPSCAKTALDKLRSQIVPTIKRHHLYQIFASKQCEPAEKKMGQFPFLQEEIEKEIETQLILEPMKKKGFLNIRHVTPEGKIISLRGGKIFSLEKMKIIIRRNFSGGTGTYDGLNILINIGDYGVSELSENQWFLKHTYYSSKGVIKGWYWNINTPIEFYPDHIRYLDLHLDVVQKPKEQPRLIDQQKLAKSKNEGFISEELAKKAYEIAHSILNVSKQ